MPLKLWHKVVIPRDLRENKPLDASELAVHLDDVRNGCAPSDYQKPDRFFVRTYLTRNLSTLATQFGVVVDTFFWTLAQALSGLFASTTEEKSWVGGVLARKKELGF